MKKIYNIIKIAVLAISFSAVSLSANSQNVQVFSADNHEGKITTKSIDKAFSEFGFVIDGNNNMNKPFSLRFKHTHYKTYNLAMFRNKELTLKLLKKYPSFGLLTPLSMSIWSDDTKKTMNISTLTLEGMSRATGIPADDEDLIAYAKSIKEVLKKAMPNGHFLELNHTVKYPKKSFQTNFTVDLDIEDDTDMEELKEEFEAEFEGEMEPIGFLFPGYLNLKEEMFEPAGFDEYDFYDTYSICKFDVIYPVSKTHPEAGAYAPCAFYIYKKKGEDKMHMGWLGVDNWITTLDIEDQESIQPLRKAQQMIENIIKDITE